MKCIGLLWTVLSCVSVVHAMQYQGYRDEERLIPLQGYSFATRFATPDQILAMVDKLKWLSPCDFDGKSILMEPSMCGCLQLPVRGFVIDLLFKMAELPGDSPEKCKQFLREHSFEIGPLTKSLQIFKYLIEIGKFERFQVMVKHKPMDKFVSWEPDYLVPSLGKIKTEFVYLDENLSLLLVKQRRAEDGDCGTLIAVKNEYAVTRPFSVHDYNKLKLLVFLACIGDLHRIDLLEMYPTIDHDELERLLGVARQQNSPMPDLVDQVCEMERY